MNWMPLSLLVAGLAAGSMPAPLVPRILAAATDAAQPREERDLKIGCAASSPKGLITFVKGRDGKILIATLTDKPLVDPALDVWLSPRLLRQSEPVRKSGTQDWAYVHDANHDGRIDQIAFLVGPQLTEPQVPDPDLPKEQGGHLIVANKAQARAFLRHMAFGFWQAVDTDFDGTPDGYAWPAQRKATGWHRGWMVTGAPGRADACELIDRDGAPLGPCSETGREFGSETATAHRWAADPAGVFAAIRDAGAACGLTGEDLRP